MTSIIEPTTGREVVLTDAFAYNGQFEVKATGFRGTATKAVDANTPTTTNIDFAIGAEDRHINGLRLILVNHDEKDTIYFSTVDKDGVLSGIAYPPGTPLPVTLKTFGISWNIDHEKNDQGKEQFNFVAKIYAGLYLRVTYVANGTANDVIVKLNAMLYKYIGG